MTDSERRLLAVLFTDIVSSTDVAVEMGDLRWRQLVARHHRVVRDALKRFGGREIDTAGDGFFATFEKPGQAIRCAAAITREVRQLGIEVRAGLHLGEVEVAARNVGGVAVHTGARVLAEAQPGEVLVTSTLRELVSGSGLAFADAGPHTLRGVPGTWRLFRLESLDGRPLDAPLDPPVAAERRAAIEPPTLLRRGRVPVVLGAALALATVALILLLGPGPPPSARGGRAEPPLGSVIQVDQKGTKLHTTADDVVISHGGGNPKIVIGEGGVWVRSSTLVHLDPGNGRVVGGGPVLETTGDPRADRGVEAGYRTVWIGGPVIRSAAVLQRWNPGSDERLSDTRIRSEIPVNDLALGYGAVWALFPDGRLVKLDADTREEVAEANAGDIADEVVAGAKGIWVLDIGNSTLIRVDPRTLRLASPTSVEGSILSMAADAEHVWLLDSVGHRVIPVDANGIVRDAIPVGEDPSGIAVGSDAVWVSDEGGTVYRIDPLTHETEKIRVGGHLTAVAVDEDTGTLWLTVGGD